jgi:hypothetical protein
MAIEMAKHTGNAFPKGILTRQQADDEERLAREVEEISGVREHRVGRQEPQYQILFRLEGRDLHDGVPSALGAQDRA